MATTKKDLLVELTIAVTSDEQDRFLNYVQENKFLNNRLAFVHLLSIGDGKDSATNGHQHGDDCAHDKNGHQGADDADEPKEEELMKKAKGRKGKKAQEELAAAAVGSDGDVEVQGDKLDDKGDGKKTAPKGRRGKKALATEEPMLTDEDHKEDEESGDDGGAAKSKKRAPAKKAAPKKGKQPSPADDETFTIDQANNESEAMKKGGRGKKAAAAPIAEVPEKDDPQSDAEVEAGKGKVTKSKADAQGGAIDAKKRRGKTAAKGDTDDADHPEAAPAAANSRRMKKTASVSSVAGNAVEDDGDHAEEPIALAVDGKTKGKRKQGAAKAQPAAAAAAGATADEGESAAATKPKRGRGAAAAKVNYAESAEESF